MNIEGMEQPANYVKAKQGQDVVVTKKKGGFKAIATVFGLLVFIGGAIAVFLITQKQDTTPIAPTAPQSKPAAYIEQTKTCTIEFNVEDKTQPDLLNCGETDCSSDSDCEDDYVCISTSETDSDGNIVKYCANEDYVEACADDPSETTCCEAEITTTVTPTTTVTVTTTVTPTTTVTATATPTPSVTTVITTVGCNDTCSANADCSNISHICYNGQCRLDVNPTDSQCKLPNGDTVITRPIKVPTQTGVADWANYIKAGLGTLGVGALLLLLL